MNTKDKVNDSVERSIRNTVWYSFMNSVYDSVYDSVSVSLRYPVWDSVAHSALDSVEDFLEDYEYPLDKH